MTRDPKRTDIDSARCWSDNTGRVLVQSPDIPRLTGQDPLLNAERNVLLDEANRHFKEVGPIRDFCRYYELGDDSTVRRPYEEYCYSDEYILHSWAYLVVGERLYEFYLKERYGEDHEFSVKPLFEGLKSATAPSCVYV